jgi:hypothetical protein
MKHDELIKLLTAKDFHLDPLGRMVIDNTEILAAINGAMNGTSSLDDMLLNGACSNNGC